MDAPSSYDYQHRQVGWIIVVLVVLVGAATFAAFVAVDMALVGLASLLFPLAIVCLFGWLTVVVDGQVLRVRFGLGVVGRAWPLAEIDGVKAVRNPWYTGWGIRYLPGCLVYNVAGFDAVEFTMRGGGRYRVGTDEPAALEAAIRARVG